MKKLTGRAAEDFADQSELDYHEFIKLPETCQNALIIEWLGTIQYKGNPLFELCFEIYWKIKPDWMSFENVCGQAITKANELYNLNN